MNQENQHKIFFGAIATVAVVFAGSILYFKTPAKPDGLLADVAASVNPQNPAVETIPTGTTAVATSSPIIPASPFLLPYSLSASTSNETYWPKYWGDVSFTDDSLALIPDPATHGANSFLNGASSWTNYAVSANVSPLMGGWFDVVARVSDKTQNFVYCEFGSNGTEIIERVNGIDTQRAFTSASTTNANRATENFGMKVYGNDIACTMNNREVVETQIQNNDESPMGGIGFVIFSAPKEQKQVEIKNISVSELSDNTITDPFPVIAAAQPVPAPTPIPATPLIVAIPPPTETAHPIQAAAAAKTLPYSVGTFGDVFQKGDGWNNWWGSTAETNGNFIIEATSSDNGGGALLAGSSGWGDYTFTATLDWIEGESFGMIARYTNDKNYVVCNFTEQTVGDIYVNLQQHQNGKVLDLTSGYINNYNELGGANITAAIQVEGNQAACAFSGHEISTLFANDALIPPLAGEIGFTAWDQTKGTSEVIVHSVGVQNNGTYKLGAYDTSPNP